MILYAGGVSGSTVSPLQCRTSRLTTSFGIVCGNLGIIVDHGYGIQNVVNFLKARGITRTIALQTHYHSDHIAALPLNSFLFKKPDHVHRIFAPRFYGTDFRIIWQQIFSPSNWPVSPDLAHIQITHFEPRYEESCTVFEEKGVVVRALGLNHTGGSVAYRIQHEDRSVVVATDHEPDPNRLAGTADHIYARFVSGASVLVADIQHRQKEHEGKISVCGGRTSVRVGHGTPELVLQALNLCPAPPKTVFATHHDPERTENDLMRFSEEAVRKFTNDGLTLSFLSDGETVIVTDSEPW